MSATVQAAQQPEDQISKRGIKAAKMHLRANTLNQDSVLLDQFSSLLSQVSDAVKSDNFKAELRSERTRENAPEEKNYDLKKQVRPEATPVESNNAPQAREADSNSSPEQPATLQEVNAEVAPEQAEQAAPESGAVPVKNEEQGASCVEQSADQVQQVEMAAASTETPHAATAEPVEPELEQALQEVVVESSGEQKCEVKPGQEKPAQASTTPVSEEADSAPVITANTEAQAAAADSPTDLPAVKQPAEQAASVTPPAPAQPAVAEVQALPEQVSAPVELHQQIAEQIAEVVKEKLGLAEPSNLTLSRNSAVQEPRAAALLSALAAEGLLSPEFKVGAAALPSATLNALELGRTKGVEAPRPAQSSNSNLDSSFSQKTQRQSESASEGTKSAKQAPRADVQKAIERVQATIKEVEKSKDGKHISLRLDPPNLGSVKVDVSYRDSHLHARIVAESPSVAQLLRDKASEIQKILREAGINADSVSVSAGGQWQGDERSSYRSEEQAARAQNNFSSLMSKASGGFAASSTRVDSNNMIEDHWVA